MKSVSPRRPERVELVEVIHVAYLVGCDAEPYRIAHAYYSKAGELLAVRDPWLDVVPSVAPDLRAVAP